LYHARITVPNGWTAVTTGRTIATTPNSNGTQTFESVSGPVREFALSVGQFASVQAEHDGTLLMVWYEKNSGLASVANNALPHLKRALSTFNQKYGAYPYREMETHLILDTRSYNYGYEMPGLIYIMSNGTYSSGTRIVLSHELAHQWFYGMLGNDIFNEPWLDEAFAQYSPYFVEQQWYGQAAADTHLQNRIINLSNQSTKPVGLSVWEYGTWNTYKNAVYGRGAYFLHNLRLRIGDAAFFKGLQTYCAKHKYGVVHKADFLQAMEEASGQDLDAFFLQWLGR
jgi:aminopeptidase N